MANYGRIEADGSLLQSSKQRDGYKLIKYAEIPDDFDQTTHYIEQSKPVEKDDHIFMGVEMHELDIEDDEFEEDEPDE